MTNQEKIQYWITLSDYDMITAQTMLDGGRYLYVGFMCHQVVEKIFKAFYSKLQEDTPPYTHALRYLAERGNFWELLSEDRKSFIDFLEPLNIRARYPDYRGELSRSLTHSVCKSLIEQTQNFQQWIKEQL